MIQGFNVNLLSKLHPVLGIRLLFSDNSRKLLLNTFPVLCLVHMLVISFNLTKIIEVDTILFYIPVLWMRRSISKKWEWLGQGCREVMKLNSEQEIKPKRSDVRALVLHTELLPPSGVKMMRVCCICINVQYFAYRKLANAYHLCCLVDVFCFFIISVRCAPTSGLPPTRLLTPDGAGLTMAT